MNHVMMSLLNHSRSTYVFVSRVCVFRTEGIRMRHKLVTRNNEFVSYSYRHIESVIFESVVHISNTTYIDKSSYLFELERRETNMYVYVYIHMK